jgi:hypothetical protein
MANSHEKVNNTLIQKRIVKKMGLILPINIRIIISKLVCIMLGLNNILPVASNSFLTPTMISPIRFHLCALSTGTVITGVQTKLGR